MVDEKSFCWNEVPPPNYIAKQIIEPLYASWRRRLDKNSTDVCGQRGQKCQAFDFFVAQGHFVVPLLRSFWPQQ